MSTGSQKVYDDKNRAARKPAQFAIGDLVKLTTGQRGIVVRDGTYRAGGWGYLVKVCIVRPKVPPRWGQHPLSLRESKILRKLIPIEFANLPPIGGAE